MVQPNADRANLQDVEVTEALGDLRDVASVRSAVDGCRYVFHIAALYRFWAPSPSEFYEVNVGGTVNLLEAARRAGCERVVYTSTSGTVGLQHRTSVDGDGTRPAREGDWPAVEHLFGSYKRSKYVAEHEALRAAAEGLPLAIVQPTMPVGPGDRAPTPSGRIVLDYLNGRFPAYFETALNVVDVDDVAAGHVLAAERGAQGRSYLLGGENLSLRAILDRLSEITGLPRVSVRIPAGLALAVAFASEYVEGSLMRRPPTVPLEATRMATTKMVFDDSRARRELGYTSRPADDALRRSARWFADNGYVSAPRLRRIRWRG
jgi:dihydroflavonol-4-reductase